MKQDYMSPNHYGDTPIFSGESHTAHSGPELIPALPQQELAHALALALLSDTIRLVQDQCTVASGSYNPFGTKLSLARR